MNDDSFRDRAIAFAAGAGSVVLILAILATGVGDKLQAANPVVRALAGQALLLSVIAAAVTAAATLRALEPIARALDSVTAMVRRATSGEFRADCDEGARRVLPTLIESLGILLAHVRASFESVQKLALDDSVTGLPNRLHFRKLVEADLARRHPNRNAALLFIDLDRFKSVNDTMGHADGDLILKAVGERLVRLADDSRDAVVARLAGDEFTMFLPVVSGPAEISLVARSILRALSEPFRIGDRSLIVGASIGIARYPLDCTDHDSLMRHADTAMYHAKELGRNQFQFYEASLHDRMRDRFTLEAELRDGLDRGEFELYFQPQIDSMNGSLLATEALIRWNHPDGSLRMPATFIPVAEDSGLIVDIGRWVIRQSARTASAWLRSGQALRISVNVAPRQLAEPDFVAFVKASLEAEATPPDLIELEITESLLTSGGDTLDTIEALRQLGVSISIDDFGTGYSNLARLRRLPVDRLKIDRSLIQDVIVSQDARTIVQAIVGLAHGLGYEVVAEGVETAAQAKLLGALGCELLQGYVYARPVPEHAFAVWRAARTEALRPHALSA